MEALGRLYRKAPCKYLYGEVLMEALYGPDEGPMESLSKPYGSPMGGLWIHGDPMEALWGYYGGPMESSWRPYIGPMEA